LIHIETFKKWISFYSFIVSKDYELIDGWHVSNKISLGAKSILKEQFDSWSSGLVPDAEVVWVADHYFDLESRILRPDLKIKEAEEIISANKSKKLPPEKIFEIARQIWKTEIGLGNKIDYEKCVLEHFLASSTPYSLAPSPFVKTSSYLTGELIDRKQEILNLINSGKTVKKGEVIDGTISLWTVHPKIYFIDKLKGDAQKYFDNKKTPQIPVTLQINIETKYATIDSK